MWVKSYVSCLGVFALDKHLEIHLQKGLVFCIWRRASNLSAVRDLGVGSGVRCDTWLCCGRIWCKALLSLSSSIESWSICI